MCWLSVHFILMDLVKSLLRVCLPFLIVNCVRPESMNLSAVWLCYPLPQFCAQVTDSFKYTLLGAFFGIVCNISFMRLGRPGPVPRCASTPSPGGFSLCDHWVVAIYRRMRYIVLCLWRYLCQSVGRYNTRSLSVTWWRVWMYGT